MKVTVVAPWGERLGGAEQVLWTMLRSLDRGRIELSVVFLSGGSFVDEVETLGIPTRLLSAGRLRQIGDTTRVVRRLRDAIRSDGADVVLNWSAKAQIYGAPAAALAGRRRHVVWWQHAIPDGHWIDRTATLLPASLVICCSDAAARAQQALRPRRRVAVVHAGVEMPEHNVDVSGLRRELGVPNDRVVVGIVGRLQPWKGQHHFVCAVAELVRRGLPVHGLVIGGAAFDLSPEYEPSLHALARAQGVSEHLTFTGQLADAARYVPAMDVLVNASQQEPYGLVLLEAMAYGLPTVAFAAGGLLEIVVDGVTGKLVAPDEPDALAGAIESLVRDASLMATLGEAGRRRVATEFTPGRAAAEVARLLTEVAQ
jgi:glycosyltransferase involved in cell wall biosynthesis